MTKYKCKCELSVSVSYLCECELRWPPLHHTHHSSGTRPGIPDFLTAPATQTETYSLQTHTHTHTHTHTKSILYPFSGWICDKDSNNNSKTIQMSPRHEILQRWYLYTEPFPTVLRG